MSLTIGLIGTAVLTATGQSALTALGMDPASNVLAATIASLLDPASSALTDAVASKVEGRNLRRASREQLNGASPPVALLAIAWSEELDSRSAEELITIIGGVSGEDVRRRLDAGWFVRSVSAPGATTLGSVVTLSFHDGKLSGDAIRLMTPHLANEIIDEFGGAPDEGLLDSWTTQRVAATVERLAEIFRDLPEVQQALLRADARAAAESAERASVVAERILRIVDGTAAAEEAAKVLAEIHADIQRWRTGDLFRRDRAGPGELPLLPADRFYIEPSARIVAPAEFAGGHDPVKSLLRQVISERPRGVVVLQAPFGFGKSVTCRSLALELLDEWDQDSQAPFPLYLHCPDVLASHVGTLSAAISRYLAMRFGASDAAIQYIVCKVRVSVILDSFDEVEQTETDAKAWLQDLSQHARSGRMSIVLASRPNAVELRWLSAHDTVVLIEPFDDRRVGAWLDAASGWVTPPDLTMRDLRASLDAEILGTPILLLMAAWSWTHDNSLRRLTKTELYQRFVGKIVTGKWSDVQPEHPVVVAGSGALREAAGESAYRLALGLTAWEHLRNEQRVGSSEEGLPRRLLEVAIRREFGVKISEEDLEAITRSLVLSMFLRKATNQQNIAFSHRSFREFLCAEYLVTRLLQEVAQPTTGFGREALTAVSLGWAERQFAAGLIEGLPTADREAVFHLLDGVIRDHRGIVIEDEHTEQHTWGRGTKILLTPTDPNRRAIVRQNAEIIDVLARRYQTSTPKILERRGFTSRWSGIRPPPDLRLIRPDVFSHCPPAYRREDGQLVLLIAKADWPALEAFRNAEPNHAGLRYERDDAWSWTEVNGELFDYYGWDWHDRFDWFDQVMSLGRTISRLNAGGWRLPDEFSVTAWLDETTWRFAFLRTGVPGSDLNSWLSVVRYLNQRNMHQDRQISEEQSSTFLKACRRNPLALRGLHLISGSAARAADWESTLAALECVKTVGLQVNSYYWGG